MARQSETEYHVAVEQLQPGVFIRLDGAWFEHPFLFNKFKIKNWEQINTLKKLGIDKVVYIPERSDHLPLRPAEAEAESGHHLGARPEVPPERDAAVQFLWQLKKDRIAKLRQKHESLKRCKKEYEAALARMPGLLQGIFSGTEEIVRQAGDTVHAMVGTFLGDTDAIVNILTVAEQEETLYSHSLNVAVLSLMLGRTLGLSKAEMHCLGLGALLHDVGKMRIDRRILRKKEALTKPEREVVRMHPQYGVETVAKAAGFPVEAAEVIAQHHERMDGSGYPRGLPGKSIRRLARIVAIADVYDNLCNNAQAVPQGAAEAMTPYQALAHMYTRQQNLLDMEIFALFIHSLGIYPPGTFVRLSNGILAMVIAVNPANPLKPSLVLYDAEVPREEAVIFDMDDDPDVSVAATLEPVQVPADAVAYLNPGMRVTYFPEQGARPA
ncbi:metal dependent phosphohydrolase [Desulfovibrio sp. X2]|uniref:HD-GYP domain-containing protein n=1 Tax=Desulfovibrio sp. X2 TaxID=941449 RepID=UPI00035898AC|nr:HD-GYP domain-containing protein [Desulfovibrio sp. X2]EPR41746.1 metal dependent phosphohydrolase [Desulfovibrio sp. X2]